MDVYLARQPILDRHQSVFAYELLCRSGPENAFNGKNGDTATNDVIGNAIHVFGLARLTGGKRAFINFTRKGIVEGLVRALPKECAVVELLETVEPDADVVAACKALKKSGYLLALDDFVCRPEYEPLVSLADIVKVDFVATGEEDRRMLVNRLAPRGIRLVAEKVETRKEFRAAREMGYTYFQGYFFCRPEIVQGRKIPASKQSYLRLIQEVNRRDCDLERIESAIRSDVSLTVKLLRYLNSAFFGLRCRVTSIRQALLLLGEQAVRKWASLAALAILGQDKPTELLVTSLLRARFCELLGGHAGLSRPSDDFFLVGLLSTLDALLDRPMADLLAEMPVSEDVKSALAGADNDLGRVFNLVLAHETGAFETVSKIAQVLNVDGSKIRLLYADAVGWADQVMQVR